MFEVCADRQPLRCLVVTDEWTHAALAIDIQGSIRSSRVIEVLSRLVSLHGAPRHLRSDHDPELVSRAVLKRLQQAGIETARIDPGRPWQHGTAGSLNGTFRDGCPGMEWFRNRVERSAIIEAWRPHDDEDRPPSGLGYRTPRPFRDEFPQRHPASIHRAVLNASMARK